MTTALRILQLNSGLGGGGTDDQCLRLAQGLRLLGQTVWVGGPEEGAGATLCRSLDVPLQPMRRTGLLKLGDIVAAARFLRAQSVDVIHAHHGRDYWRAVLAARLGGARSKVVLTRHMAFSPSSWASRHFLLDRVDAVIAVSHFVARVLKEGVYEPDSPDPVRRARPPLRGNHAQIEVVPNGVDTARFRPQPALAQRRAWRLAPEHYALGVVGAYGGPRGKGQREFLEAAARLYAARCVQSVTLPVVHRDVVPKHLGAGIGTARVKRRRLALRRRGAAEHLAR